MTRVALEEPSTLSLATMAFANEILIGTIPFPSRAKVIPRSAEKKRLKGEKCKSGA